MSDAHDLLKILRGGTDTKVSFLLGTIPSGYTTGRPTIQFDGESTTSSRTYPYISGYVPAVGDRVLLAVVGNGGVIIGKIV